MTRFLRTTRRGRWIPNITWLAQGEIQGDAFLDLQPKDNTLSVWRVESKSDINRIVAAIAANRDHLAILDYAIVEKEGLSRIGVVSRRTEGTTNDAEVNEIHYDLVELTVRKLAALADLVATGNHCRTSKREIKDLLWQGIQAGHLKRQDISPSILQKLG